MLLFPNSNQMAEYFIPRHGTSQHAISFFQIEPFVDQTLWIAHPRFLTRALDSQSPIEMSCIHSDQQDRVFFIKCSNAELKNCRPIWNIRNVTNEICHGMWKTTFTLENFVDIYNQLLLCTKEVRDGQDRVLQTFYSPKDHPLIIERSQGPEWTSWSSWSYCTSGHSFITRNRTRNVNDSETQHKYCKPSDHHR